MVQIIYYFNSDNCGLRHKILKYFSGTLCPKFSKLKLNISHFVKSVEYNKSLQFLFFRHVFLQYCAFLIKISVQKEHFPFFFFNAAQVQTEIMTIVIILYSDSAT